MRAAVCFLVLALLSAVGFAQTTWADATSVGGRVFVNEAAAFEIRTESGGLSAAQRAEIVVQRVVAAQPGAQATVLQEGNDWRVLLGDGPLLTITPEEAAAHGRELPEYAQAVARSVNGALSLGPLQIGISSVTVPEEGNASVRLTGSRARQANLKYDTEVIEITREPGRLQIKAKKLGRTVLEVTNGPASLSLPISVLRPAARFPQSVQAEVLGSPASADDVRSAAMAAVRSYLVAVPGANVDVAEVTGATALAVGAKQTWSVPVSVTARDHLQMQGQVQVTVTNVGVSFPEETALWYSNDPENLRQPGPLFAGQLESAKPVRLLFHHRNAMTRGMVVKVLLVNPTDQPARVAAVTGDGRPDRNPTLVGLNAADQFWRAYLNDSAEIIQIPPQSILPLAVRQIPYDITMSGLVGLELLPGGAETVWCTVDAVWNSDADLALLRAADRDRPWNQVRPRGLGRLDPASLVASSQVYPAPFRRDTFRYEVGGRFVFFRIGEKAIPSADESKILEGNFGVIYQVEGTLANLTSAPSEVEVVVEASAGYGAALFLVDGRYVRLEPLQPKAEAVLRTLTLQPGQTTTIRLQSIPLSGSNYPITVIVRPTKR